MDYELKYSKRRKTLGIIIERDGKVVVTAPEGLPPTRVDELVKSKAAWIEEKIKEQGKYLQDQTKKEFVNGEYLLYLGHPCRLNISDEQFKGVRYDGDFTISRHSQEKASDIFQAWYKKQCLETVKPLAERYAKSLGVAYNECQVVDMHYRWASCTPKGNLRFNWRAIKAPLTVVQYLIVHELAHLIEPNHSEAFWNIVAVQVPSYKEAKEWLRVNGAQIETDF